MTDDLKLAPRQQQLYDLLVEKGDVPILVLYDAMKASGEKVGEVRYAQQWLGSYIVALNRRLKRHKQRVIPGQIKGTYCLTATR